MEPQETKTNSMDSFDPHRAHSRQRFWQIFLPVILVCVLAVAALVLLIQQAGGQADLLAQKGQVATVFVVLPWFLIFFVTLVIVVGLIYAITKLIAWVPSASRSAVNFLTNANYKIRDGADATTKPVITVQMWAARLSRLRNLMNPKYSQGKTK
ncbi:MAG: hypothetical protein WA116_00500 [Anaerolineaceae bacterium]